MSKIYKDQFLPYNNAYLYKPSNPEVIGILIIGRLAQT